MYSENEVKSATLEYFNGDTLATDVWMKKYALKNKNDEYLEKTPDDMHRRLASEFSRIEMKYPYPLTEEEIFSVLKDFKHIVPQGSPMSGIGNIYSKQSLSNCVVVASPEDNMSSIFDKGKELANLFKNRCGVGMDMSKLRPEGTPVNNSAKTSTGAWSFCDLYSNITRMIGQNNRRGALMLTMDIRHPDIFKFVTMKHDLTKVTGANISVKISDEFMNAVKEDKNFILRFPVTIPANEKMDMEYNVRYNFDDGMRIKIKAKELWKVITESATQTAEPGILMWDNILRRLPAESYNDFKTMCTNPCIIGTTMIALADGRNYKTIKELVDEGKDVPVYSTNIDTGKVEIKMGRNPRKTGEKKEVWKLKLDDGSELIATSDHKILMKNLEYKELKDLKEGESVFPFNSFDSNGYRQVSFTGARMSGGNRYNRRQYRLITEFHGFNKDPKIFAIHHRNYNKKDDSIENLEVMNHKEHRKLHSERIKGKNNPYHKMSDEWKFNFSSHPGKRNPKYIDVSNEELLEHGRKLFEKFGKLTKRMWCRYAKENGLPMFLANEFRFKSFSNFKNQVLTNHKVISVEFFGFEDVYNLTVDDNYNYHVLTKISDKEGIVTSGLCVKNCGEIPLSANDSCRLISVNLSNFVENEFTNEAQFNFEKFKSIVTIAMRLSDDLIDLELEKLERIYNSVDDESEKNIWKNMIESATKGRRTGLGTHGLADTLAKLRLSYGSPESLTFIDRLFSIFKNTAYDTSVELANERGTFPVYDENIDHCEFFDELDSDVKYRMKKYGRRNISILTNAPTGSVSILSQTSSGIEPVFRNFYERRRKLTTDDKIEPDFVDANGDRFQQYKVYHHNVRKYIEKFGETLPNYFIESQDLDWKERVAVQSIIQRHIDHSISSTINLPKGTTSDTVEQIYMTGWEEGLKGITVYVDGSRDGVLITEKKDKFLEREYTKRPDVLDCDIHHKIVDGERYIVMIGLLDGRPYEVFAGKEEKIQIPRKYEKGKIIKREYKTRPNEYDLSIDDGLVKDIVTTFNNPDNSSLGRMISLSLRYGSKIPHVVEQLLQTSEDSSMTCFSKVLARVLKQYIPDGTKAEKGVCPECGQNSLIFKEGCVQCSQCAWSKCS